MDEKLSSGRMSDRLFEGMMYRCTCSARCGAISWTTVNARDARCKACGAAGVCNPK